MDLDEDFAEVGDSFDGQDPEGENKGKRKEEEDLKKIPAMAAGMLRQCFAVFFLLQSSVDEGEDEEADEAALNDERKIAEDARNAAFFDPMEQNKLQVVRFPGVAVALWSGSSPVWLASKIDNVL